MPVAINTADMNEKGGQLDQGPREKKGPLFQRPKRQMAETGTEKQRKGGVARKDSGA